MRDRASSMLRDLRRSGLKLTPQRAAIVRLFAEDNSHPTAQDLFERLRPSFPQRPLVSAPSGWRSVYELDWLREDYLKYFGADSR